MGLRLVNRLSQLVDTYLQTETDPAPIVDLLAQALSAAMSPEMDRHIQRHSLRLPPGDDDSSSLDRWLMMDSTGNSSSSLPLRRKLQEMCREIARHSSAYKRFRLQTLETCSKLVSELWRLRRVSGSVMDLPLREREDTDHCRLMAPRSTNTEADAVLALSSFSLLDHSMKEVPADELHSVVDLIVAPDLDLAVRKANLQKLLQTSPQWLARAKSAFDLFLGHLHALLPIHALFGDTMRVLSRLLGSRDESIWCKTLVCLCRVALNVMRSQGLDKAAKRSLVLFFRQIFCIGPHIWRSFTAHASAKIVQSLMELLTAETSAGGCGAPTADGFLATFARVDPKVDWIRQWLHNQSLRTAMAPKLAELLAEVLEPGPDMADSKLAGLPHFWAFQCCLLLHAVRHPKPVFRALRDVLADSTVLVEQKIGRRLADFLSLASSGPPHRHGFARARKAVAEALLETATSDDGTQLLVGSGMLPRLLDPAHRLPGRLQWLPLKLLLNVLTHCPELPLPSALLHAFAAFCLQHSQTASECRQLGVKVLSLLLEKFSPAELAWALPELPAMLAALLPAPDPSIVAQRRLLIAPCLLPIKNAAQLKLLRRNKGKLMERLWLKQSQPMDNNLAGQPCCWLSFPMPIRPTDEELRVGHRMLLQFIGPAGEESARPAPKAEGCRLQRLDFLRDSREVPMSPTIFVLITQPGLLAEYFRSAELCQELQHRFADFEAHKGSSASLLRFVAKLDLLVTNLDFLVDLKRLIPNLSSRLVQMLHRFCTDSEGQQLFDELSQQTDRLLSHLLLGTNSERQITGTGQIQSAIQQEVPESLYWSKKDEKLQSSRRQKWPEEGAERLLDERAFSLGLVEEELFPLSLLPADPSAKGRRSLLRTYFSPRWRAKSPVRVDAFTLLRTFVQRFPVAGEEASGRPRLIIRPPPHSEWLPLVADYALSLGLAQDRAQLRKRMAGHRLLAEGPPDWLLAALFLSSGLCPDSTTKVGEWLLQHHQQEEFAVATVWAQAAPSDRPLDDQVLLRVFPLVLGQLRQQVAFRRVLPLLASVGLPSLLHLLLFYVQRAYLGILPFPAIQDYLLLALLGGVELQALHLCTVLAHICQTLPEAILCQHSSSAGQILRLFLRPDHLLDSFDFSRYAHLLLSSEEADECPEAMLTQLSSSNGGGQHFDEWI